MVNVQPHVLAVLARWEGEDDDVVAVVVLLGLHWHLHLRLLDHQLALQCHPPPHPPGTPSRMWVLQGSHDDDKHSLAPLPLKIRRVLVIPRLLREVIRKFVRLAISPERIHVTCSQVVYYSSSCTKNNEIVVVTKFGN